MSAGDDRVFHYAILASVALHALMLSSFSMKDAARRAAAEPAPIVARIVEQPAAPAPPAAKSEPTPPRTEKPPPPPKPKPPPPVEKAPPAPPPVPAVPPAPAAAEPVPETPAPSAAPAPSAPAAAPSTPAAPAARSGPDEADTLARFRMQVIQAALKYKRYPRVALDNAWEGRADVRVSFNADGRRASIVVVRSSGHEVLDRQAVDTVTKAFVPVPPALRGKTFAFDIPVIFNLKEEPSG